MKLLPPAYGEIARNELLEYFPEDFGYDLNGKTLSYEAIVLIPFCAEHRVLEEEAKINTSGRV
jgi:5'-3' exonuclease